jgi:four helix bundle protein
MNAEELKARTKQFALRVIRLVRCLPKTVDGRAVAGQLVRAGTSVGANYRATCKSRSRAEFVARIGVVEEEADESAYWLELVIESDMMQKRLVLPLWDEAKAIEKIMAQSRISAARRSAGR